MNQEVEIRQNLKETVFTTLSSSLSVQGLIDVSSGSALSDVLPVVQALEERGFVAPSGIRALVPNPWAMLQAVGPWAGVAVGSRAG